MKKTLFFLFFFFISTTSLMSQIERYDSLYTVASSNNFNYRNPSFEEKDIWPNPSNDLNLTYEKRDTLNSKSNIVYRKAGANEIGPEVMITNDNFLNLSPASSHTMIVWHTNRNSDLNIYYSVYSNSAWSAPAPLGLNPAYELNPSVAEAVINNNTAYYIVYESMGDVYLKVLYQGSLLTDTNLTANVSDACSSPKIRYYNSSRHLYISYLKNVNSVKRIVLLPAVANTDFSISWQPVFEIIQNNSAENIGFAHGANFVLQGFLIYNYDTLGSSHSMGISLSGSSKLIFTDQFPGRNFNGTGTIFPIITDNSNHLNYFTTFGWNRKSSDSSFILAGYGFPSNIKKFYIGDSSISAKPDISDYVNAPNSTILFRIVWEQKVNGRFAIMESRLRDFFTGIHEGNENAAGYSLSQNYPNPFNPETVISYTLPTTQYTILTVYNALGKLVATLVNQKQNAGSYNYQFSTVNYQLPSGIYFYRLEAGDFTETKRMVLIK